MGRRSSTSVFFAPSSATVSFAKALNRKVTGSMNELVMAATHSLESGEVAPHNVGFYLNDLLLSAIATREDRGYGKPKEAFNSMLGSQPATEMDKG
jgi:hypothetical protein